MGMSGKIIAFIVPILSLTAGSALAGQATTNFAVTATVVATCGVSATPLAFGDYTGSTNVDQTSTISVTCTTGTDYTVALNDGNNASGGVRRMVNGGSNYLAYEMYSDAGRTTAWNATATVAGTGTGIAQSLTVYGRVASGQNVPAGAYSDTVQVTVSY